MKCIQNALKSVDLQGGNVFEVTDELLMYIVQDTIVVDLWRNLSLALAAVFVCTWFLMGDVRASLIVPATIMLTLLNVGGKIMHGIIK